MSMFLVPSDTPGIRVLQDIGHLGQRFGGGMHAHVRYENVRVPNDNLLGGEGKAFEVAQRRLGGGRIHHAMRTVATCQRYFEMMCERALSRTTKGGLLAEKQMVQEQIADSWIELQEFRLLVLYTAWLIDNSSAREVRQYVAACKVRASQVMSKIGSRATHLHGALGVSNLMPLGGNGEIMATVDGPTEVHQVTIARQVMKDHKPSADNWPTRFRPRVLLESRRQFEEIVARRLDAAERAELDELVQDGHANDAAVKRFEEYLELTADV
jgi:acyl-CoA dehydrogenase